MGQADSRTHLGGQVQLGGEPVELAAVRRHRVVHASHQRLLLVHHLREQVGDVTRQHRAPLAARRRREPDLAPQLAQPVERVLHAHAHTLARLVRRLAADGDRRRRRRATASGTHSASVRVLGADAKGTDAYLGFFFKYFLQLILLRFQ